MLADEHGVELRPSYYECVLEPKRLFPENASTHRADALSLLRLLHERGVPMEREVWLAVSKRPLREPPHRYEILDWLLLHAPPLDVATCRAIASSGRKEMVDWLREKGYA